MQSKDFYQDYYLATTNNMKLLSPASKKEKILKGKKPSLFYQAVVQLVEDTREMVEAEPKRPRYDGKLWEERKNQIRILEAALENAKSGYVYDDTALYKTCIDMSKVAKTKVFSPYNAFCERLDSLLERTDPIKQVHLNTQLNLQLLEEDLRKNKLQLEENLPYIHQAKQNLLKEFRKSPSGQSLQDFLQQTNIEAVLNKLLVDAKQQQMTSMGEEVLDEVLSIKQKLKTLENAFQAAIKELAKENLRKERLKEKYPHLEELSQDIEYDGLEAVKIKDQHKITSTAEAAVKAGMFRSRSKSFDDLGDATLQSRSESEFVEIKL